MLLLERMFTSKNLPVIEDDDETKLTRRINFFNDLESEFWKLRFAQTWDQLFPHGKWKDPVNKLEIGDISQGLV